MIEILAFLIGLIIAIICTVRFGGNIVTFIVIWGAGMFVSGLLLLLASVFFEGLLGLAIPILIIGLLIVLIKRVSTK